MLNKRELSQLSSFQSIKQMDSNINNFLYHHKFDLTESTYKVLRDLQQHSVKYIGISFSKYETIAQRLSISSRTVIRAIKSLTEYGIIQKIKTRKNTGKQGTNVFVFQQWHSESHAECHSVQEQVEPTETKSHAQQSTINTVYKQDISIKKQKLNKRKKDENFDHTFVSTNIPKQFVDAIYPYFGSARDIYKLWRRLTLASRKCGDNYLNISHMDTYIKVFKESIYRLKQGKVRGDFVGYLYGAWQKTAHLNVMQFNAREKGIYFDWLND